MKPLRYILISTIAATALSANARNSISTTISNSVVDMGSYVSLQIQAVVPDNSDATIVRITDLWPAEVELRPDSTTDTRSLGNGLNEITRKYTIQSFDSGVYVIPPFMLINGSDTALSEVVSLKVNPIDVSELETIHPMASVADAGRRWYDFLPDWVTENWIWILACVLIVAAGVVGVLIFTNRIHVPFIPEKKPEPPYDQAKRLLALLREEHLWEKGREKEYYSELTDILRRYISRRFGVNAMEMTSGQLLKALDSLSELNTLAPQVKYVLDTADFVKFARMQPKPDVNVKTFEATDNFIETTRPVDIPEEISADQTAPDAQDNNSEQKLDETFKTNTEQ